MSDSDSHPIIPHDGDLQRLVRDLLRSNETLRNEFHAFRMEISNRLTRGDEQMKGFQRLEERLDEIEKEHVKPLAADVDRLKSAAAANETQMALLRWFAGAAGTAAIGAIVVGLMALLAKSGAHP